ncbi:MAG: hypothetical protein RLZZ253_2466, partial [Verrucomicrobiota bacterium]
MFLRNSISLSKDLSPTIFGARLDSKHHKKGLIEDWIMVLAFPGEDEIWRVVSLGSGLWSEPEAVAFENLFKVILESVSHSRLSSIKNRKRKPNKILSVIKALPQPFQNNNILQ